MKVLKNLIIIAGTLTLGGCTIFNSFSEVDALNQTSAVGSPFTQTLTTEYREFANHELHDGLDYPDALHFARKGLAAASGEVVLPEPTSDWNLSEPHQQELGAARGRLLVAFDLGGREVAPKLAAMAQARFDCWIEAQEESWRSFISPSETSALNCKDQFTNLINQLEAAIQAPIARPAAPIGVFEVDANAPMRPENAMYLVFFDWNASKVTMAASNVLAAASGEITKNPPSTVHITGHADTSGPKSYNKRLAFKRANAARDALITNGVDASIIAVDAKGENDLLVPTADNVREPANRRANISFE